MAVYRNDPDLNLLGQCSNDELQLLVSILTTDPRDGGHSLDRGGDQYPGVSSAGTRPSPLLATDSR
ncbi:TPA: DUF3944 domain-containing protein [Enterobacter kobei]